MEVEFMEIITHESDCEKRLLTNDYCPNPAMKNCFQTQFFTCTLRKIELCGQTLNQFHVDEGAQFLLMHLTVHNMTNEILSMFKEDFYIKFDGEGPFEPEEEFGVTHQFPDTYALKPNEEMKGVLVFLIAQDTKKIVFSYTEYFDDESEGKTYRLKYDLKS